MALAKSRLLLAALKLAKPARRSHQAGTSALEFALISPVFLMLLFGIINFGLYFGSLIAVTNAAADGARASVAGLTNTERATLATQAAQASFATYAPFLQQNYVTISAQSDQNNAQRFLVSVSYDFSSYDIFKLSSLAPSLVSNPSITMSVANAGYY